jgi:SagB-type dehydrogenase family enzyme
LLYNELCFIERHVTLQARLSARAWNEQGAHAMTARRNFRKSTVGAAGRGRLVSGAAFCTLASFLTLGWGSEMSPAPEGKAPPPGKEAAMKTVQLPKARTESNVSLESTFLKRRSVRSYKDEPITLEELGQLLWAAQGITYPPEGLRTAPSAGALYPLELYVAAGSVAGLTPGVYRYAPQKHTLRPVMEGDMRAALSAAALGQDAVKNGAAVLVFSGVHRRTTKKYGRRGVRYVHIEAGHAAQNVCLQAEALGLGALTVGAFDDAKVHSLLKMGEGEEPLYLMPVGKPF